MSSGPSTPQERRATTSSPPARPHHRFTAEGRRVREVLSYSRRGSRLTESQQQAWDRFAHVMVIPDHDVESSAYAWHHSFARQAPLIIEIGSGVGEATLALATAHPEVNVLSLEVWRPGVAEGLARVGGAGLGNVRFCMIDAVWLLQQRVAEQSLSEVVTFFPDPWHKARHHKRRLINSEFAALVASRLTPGGVWRIATDWAGYADHIDESVAAAAAELIGGRVTRWEGRPLTRFERKGIAAGREIVDFCFERHPRTTP